MTEFKNYKNAAIFGETVEDNYGSASPTHSNLIHDNTCYTGIELEMEGVFIGDILGNVHPKFWAVDEDGSLKYKGIELKLKCPLTGKKIIESLEELKTLIDLVEQEVYTKGDRGSTHFHLDVSGLNVAETARFYALACICEPYLFSQCPPSRASTVFCLPVTKTRDIKSILGSIFHGPHGYGFNTEYHKYRGIGLSSMYERGSIEFRMFDTCLNTQRILGWLNLLQKIRQMAVEELPDEFFKTCTDLDIDGFLYNLVGIPFHISPVMRSQIWNNLRSISYAYKSFDPVWVDSPADQSLPAHQAQLLGELSSTTIHTHAFAPSMFVFDEIGPVPELQTTSEE